MAPFLSLSHASGKEKIVRTSTGAAALHVAAWAGHAEAAAALLAGKAEVNITTEAREMRGWWWLWCLVVVSGS
eukprot:Skav220308  [mRNA]  locus=scaffold525:58043:59284:+ [translate_table: standard]